MDIFNSAIVFTFFGIFIYFSYSLFTRFFQKGSLTSKELGLIASQLQQKDRLDLESKQKFKHFTDNAKFLDPIAVLNSKTVYDYVYVDGALYRFKEFTDKDSSLFLISTEDLVYSKAYYVRTTPSAEFLQKHASQLS